MPARSRSFCFLNACVTLVVSACTETPAPLGEPGDAETAQDAPASIAPDVAPAPDVDPADLGSERDAGLTALDLGVVAPDASPPDAGADAGATPPDAGRDSGVNAGVVPRGCVQGVFQPYYGNLHSHSTMSDGSGRAEEAFTHARDQAHLDIMVLTDHMEQLLLPRGEYDDCRAIAATFDAPGTFLADCGFEYATSLFGLTGHNNVFFSPELFPLALGFEAFYRDLGACADCIGQFNHPGDSAGHTWRSFRYDAAADAKLNLFEFNTDADPWELFFQALDAGWHVSPTYDQDNHGTDWGTKNDRRSGYYLSMLSRAALREAMLDRRSFMTHDKNASLLMMAEGRCWMGSILSGVHALNLSVEARDGDAAEGFARLELYGPGRAALATHDCAGANPCTFTFSLTVTSSTYVVARAIERDDDPLVSAPIWAAP